jgi:hypothetical protein
MKRQFHRVGAVIAGVCLWVSFGGLAGSRIHSLDFRAAQKETVVTTHATGTFEVKLTPQAPEAGVDASLGRMTIDKQFHGDLEATSNGQILTAGTAVAGSAGYVAMERVSGKLRGRSGSFALQHTGTMAHGAFQLSVTVVPDSGTGELVGIAGAMKIIIDSGKHSYEFDYTLPEAH